ncbi:MAG: protein-ADP-ribose hydrolase [Clostridia bacterium]|nr:protein-ADP-ribose hydrolase [Clostridia bacterium]
MQEDKLNCLVDHLLSERSKSPNLKFPRGSRPSFNLYRSLVNVRPAMAADDEYLQIEDEYLTKLIAEKGITDIKDLTPIEDGIYLWQGDITTLKCTAIVNAANSAMTGCYQPCHSCIDNCIHTYAGVRLRYKCDELIRAQGHEEPTGSAKITPAYNLPSDYVIHTVGPIVRGFLTDNHRCLLQSCYTSCLDIAVQNGIDSIAFCCISTGVYGFPQKPAVQIAVDTVREYIKTHDIKVVFNVFGNKDLEIYEDILGR